MNNDKRERDYFLLSLIIINLANAILMLIGGNALKIKYITLGLNLVCILFCKKDKILPVILYSHCNSALYDDIGFKYLFNFAVVISVFKLMVIYKQKVNKINLYLFLLLLFWEIILILKLNDINGGWLQLISWISSYLILIIYSSKKENIKFREMYKYFSVGFVMAFICGITLTINRWGIQIPTGYRFTGLLRDPNYYCIDAMFLIFSAPTYAKLSKKEPILYMILFFVLGIISVSKTFILLVSLGILFIIASNLRKIKITTSKIIIFLAIIIIVIQSNCIEIIKEKYLYRIDTTTLFTGRDYIQSYYLNKLFSSPSNILIGNSVTKYSKILGLGQESGREFFTDMVAHNTYLDVILSWGIVGTCLYIAFLYKVLQEMEKKYIDCEKKSNKDFIIVSLLFAIGLFALSYLSADIFAILILYIFILKYALYSEQNESEGGENK